jgi:sarcosine oxidase, subunit alpha
MIGHVTSSYFSPTLGRSIALALLDGGLKRMGERVTAVLPDRTAAAIVGKSRFYDLDGERLHG